MANFFDDFLDNLQDAGQDFVSNQVGGVLENIGLTTGGITPRQNPGQNNNYVNQRPTAGGQDLKNNAWPMPKMENIMPFVILGGAVVLALVLRRK